MNKVVQLNGDNVVYDLDDDGNVVMEESTFLLLAHVLNASMSEIDKSDAMVVAAYNIGHADGLNAAGKEDEDE